MIRLYLKIILLFLPGFCFAQTKPVFQRTPDGPNIIADANLKVNKYLIVPISSVSGIVGGSIDSAGYLRYNPITKTFQGYFGPVSGWATIGTGSGSGGTVTTVSINSANGISGSVSNPTTTPALTISLDSLNKWVTKTQLNLKANKYTTITINGVTQDLSANRTWTTGTITSITPGIGFASHTPITSSGTINLDTTTTIATKHTSIYTVKNLTLLKNYTGVATTISVSDTLRGGIFTYTTAILTPDSGIVFSATGKGSGYWKRVREKNDFYNVKWFGAKGNDSNRDNFYIQQAIITAEAHGGGTVYLPSGIYRCYHIVPAVDFADGRLRIITSGVKLIGQSKETSILKFLSLNGADPNGTVKHVNFDVVSAAGLGPDSQSVRSPGIVIRPIANNQTSPILGTVIQGLTFDGGTDHTTDGNWPSDKDTGDGWDLSHKAILFYGDGQSYSDHTVIQDCELKRWRGEVIWEGGTTHTDIHILRCQVHNSNASMISGCFKEVSDCEAYDGIGDGFENYPNQERGWYHKNYIHNVKNGIIHGGSTADILESRDFIISDNIIEKVTNIGVLLTRQIQNVSVQGNRFVDCIVGVTVQPQDKKVKDIVVQNNTFTIRDTNNVVAINIIANAYPLDNIHISNNTIEATSLAVDSGRSFYRGIVYNGSGMQGAVYATNNFFKGQAFLLGDSSLTKNLVVNGNHVIESNHYPLFVGNFDNSQPEVATITIDPFDEIDGYVNYGHLIPLTLKASKSNLLDRRRTINMSATNVPAVFIFKKSEPNLLIGADIMMPQNAYVLWEFNGSKWIVVEMVGAYYINAVGTRSVSDASSVALSKSTLNTNYPTFVHNEVVFVPTANLKYIKMDDSTTGNWDEQPYNPAP